MVFILAFTSILVMVYLGLVIGTYEKYTANRIKFTTNSKFIIPLLPIRIIFAHIRWSMKYFRKNDKNMAFIILKMGTIKYPLALGLIIELQLEQIAYEYATSIRPKKVGKKLARIRERKNHPVTEFPPKIEPIMKEYVACMRA